MNASQVRIGRPDPRNSKAILADIGRALRGWQTVPAAGVAIYLIAGIIGPWVAPHNPYQGELRDILLPVLSASTDERPESGNFYLLGTDWMGRDILSRVLYAARDSVYVALPAAAIGLALAWIVSQLLTRLCKAWLWIARGACALIFLPPAILALGYPSAQALIPFMVRWQSYAGHLLSTVSICALVAYAAIIYFRSRSKPVLEEGEKIGDSGRVSGGSREVVTISAFFVVLATLGTAIVFTQGHYPSIEPNPSFWGMLNSSLIYVGTRGTVTEVLLLIICSVWASIIALSIFIVLLIERRYVEINSSARLRFTSESSTKTMDSMPPEASGSNTQGEDQQTDQTKPFRMGLQSVAQQLKHSTSTRLAVALILFALFSTILISTASNHSSNTIANRPSAFQPGLDPETVIAQSVATIAESVTETVTVQHCIEIERNGFQSDACDQMYAGTRSTLETALSMSLPTFFRQMDLPLALGSLTAFVLAFIVARLNLYVRVATTIVLSVFFLPPIVLAYFNAPIDRIFIWLQVLRLKQLAESWHEWSQQFEIGIRQSSDFLIVFAFSYIWLLLISTYVSRRGLSSGISEASSSDRITVNLAMYLTAICFSICALVILFYPFPTTLIIADHILAEFSAAVEQSLQFTTASPFAVIDNGAWLYWINVSLYGAMIAIVAGLAVWIYRRYVASEIQVPAKNAAMDSDEAEINRRRESSEPPVLSTHSKST